MEYGFEFSDEDGVRYRVTVDITESQFFLTWKVERYDPITRDWLEFRHGKLD